jgi:hypothetical protein
VGVSRERFESGLTYEQWKAQMTRNRERHDANEQGLPLTEADLAPFKNLPHKVNVLMLAEDWCGDVIANTPIVGRIASEVDTLNLRVFLRDQNEDLMNQYLKEGSISRSRPSSSSTSSSTSWGAGSSGRRA